MKILCLFGLHNWKTKSTFYPNIKAKFVHRVVFDATCLNCGKKGNNTDTTFLKNGDIIDNLIGD